MALFGKVVLIALFVALNISNCLAIPKELSSKEIFDAVQILRAEIQKLTTDDLFQEDFILENWLRLKNFEVQATLEALVEYIQWRTKENIASILQEDWSDMRANFPYSVDTLDKLGRPVLYIDVGQWDFRTYLDSGDEAYDRLTRYIFMYNEDILTKLRELRASGSNVTQWSVVGNLANFTTGKMACVKCLQLARYVTDIGTKFSTHSFGKAILVNVPYFSKMVYFFLSAESRAYFELYGQDRSQWEPMLLDIIERSQLPQGILAELPEKDNLEGLMVWDKEL